jgi:aspartate-semialdehyde dehydrogenase
VPFRGTTLRVEAVHDHAFAGVDIALFAVKNPHATRWAPVARAAGAVVVDNSSAHRYLDEVPLVVPEVNGGLLAARPTLIANPNCSAAPLVMALAALRPLARLESVVVSTYQSVSGAGAEALTRLDAETRSGLAEPLVCAPGQPPPFAFNVIPHIDRFEDNGYTREEMKVVWESRRILDQPDLPISVTAVRVPVRVGHSAAVTARFDRPVEPGAARAALAAFPGIEVVDEPAAARYPMPLQAAGREAVLVGRVRRDLAHPHGLVFWAVSDNLLKGAALNAVQIAERVVAMAAGAR